MFEINDAALIHEDAKEHRGLLGITHMGFNRKENRIAQPARPMNHIIQTLQCAHANWSHSTHDDVDKLCGAQLRLSAGQLVADIHWTCQSAKNIKHTCK